MESLLQKKLDIKELRLVISFIETNHYDSSGVIRLPFLGLEPSYPDEVKPLIEKGITIILEGLTAMQQLFIQGVNYNLVDETLYVLIDTVGPTQPSPQEIERIEKQAVNITGFPVKLHVHSQPAVVITATGYQSYRDVSRAGFLRQLPAAQSTVQRIIEVSD
jgi:hypothetical protein